jgi:glycosyltransferase involved in cell wall biosynthesis
MNEQLPLVSIITPSYNQGRFIEDAILSVENQDYLNIEHIIIDGGSTDETLKILEKYENTYNMHWVSEPDNGQADAINKGFYRAKGEIIGWINSDDAYFDVRTISTIVKYFQTFKDINVLYGNAARIDENNLLLFIIKPGEFDRNYLKKRCFLVQPAVFFRKKIIDEFRLDTSLDIAMDYDFWRRISKFHDFKYINKIFAVDRTHRDRKVNARRTDMIKEAIKVSKEYGNFDKTNKLQIYYTYFLKSIYGIYTIWNLYHEYNLAFDIKLDAMQRTMLRQIKP